jgi:nicotinamide mononucleotide transporter
MIGWLNTVAFTALGAPTTWAEVIGFVTGLVTVWLVVREHIANWPLGIANVLVLMLVFWTAGLYADAGLQVVYVVLGGYGWWQWSARRNGPDGREVRRTSRGEWLALAVAGIVLTGPLWLFLDRLTSSTVPLADAVTTALSLLATYGQSRKWIESWWLWIAADVIYIPLYGLKHLWLTAALYAVFLALCLIGLRSWRATYDRATRPPAPVGTTA